MMVNVECTGAGVVDGPTSPDNYKRAVYRAPPSRFSVDMLPPTKQGGSFSFGMRICPIRTDSASIASQPSVSEYEVWRRWEDCLIFQETLETEYSRMARSKKQRLVAGRGVKKNGVYIHDQAASFESLPPGPDPNSVALDIHAYLPKLTKKGTLFRASQSTVDQRHRELSALIQGLFSPDAPALIHELRQDRIITDFFGFWRRDQDLVRKQKRPTTPKSASNSVHSPTSPQLTLGPPRTSHRLPSRPHTSSGISSIRSPSGHLSVDDDGSYRTRPKHLSGSSASSSGTSSLQSKGSRSSDSVAPVIIPQEPPFVFGHNPEQASEVHGQDRSSSGLRPLPEGRELSGSDGSTEFFSDGGMGRPPVRRLRKSQPGPIRANRNAQIFMTPPPSPTTGTMEEREGTLSLDALAIRTADHSVRDSWQTTTSVSDYLENLNLQLLPGSRYSHQSVASTASIATFRTDCSADAVVPRYGRSLSENTRQRDPTISDSDSGSERENRVNSYYYDSFAPRKLPMSPKSQAKRPETPLGHFSSASSTNTSTHLSSFFQAGSSSSVSTSPRTSVMGDPSRSPRATPKSPAFFPDSPISAAGGSLAIKAAHNNAIVVMRTPRCIQFDELRRRLYDKFVRQEGIPLSESFTIAHVMQSPTTPMSDKPRSRSNSASSASASVSDAVQMYFITSQAEWEQATSSIGFMDKLTLRVLDTPS